MSEAGADQTLRPTALVTGATGFVGAHLVRRLLREGWQVHILTRATASYAMAQEFEHITYHVHDGSTECMVRCLERSGPNVVFHLASLFLSHHSPKDVRPLLESNLIFGSQLLEAMHLTRVKLFVNTGTSWQHYNNEAYNPVCLYAATKQAFEGIIEYYVQACEFSAITLKLFDTYGRDDTRKKLIHLLRNAVSTGEILEMSPGEQVIDLVHVDDVVEAYLIAARRLLEGKVVKHESYGISSGNPMPLREVVRLYAEVTGRMIPVRWGARPYRNREVMTPWRCGEILPGWRPLIGLRDGLRVDDGSR